MKNNIIFIVVVIYSLSVYSQTTFTKTLWDKECNCPVKYASISNSSTYSITNEEGLFSLTTKEEYAEFNMLGYESFKFKLSEIKNDTIYLKSKPFKLDEVIVDSDSYFRNMVKTVGKDYALDPHSEKFYLRAILKRNNEIIKLVDISGKVRKETLFDTRSVPMPKNNYSVQIENIRKAGKIFKDYDFTIINFENFFYLHNRFYIGPKIFNIEYKSLEDKSYTKILASQKKDKSTSDTKGYFLVNNETMNFVQANIITEFFNEFSEIGKKLKSRTVLNEVTSNFNRSPINNKLQINKCNITIQAEVIYESKLDKFELSFIYLADPIEVESKIKNNVNHKKDIFDLKFNHDEVYWQNQEKLPLTKEMQKFINEVNSSDRNSDFKTKTNTN